MDIAVDLVRGVRRRCLLAASRLLGGGFTDYRDDPSLALNPPFNVSITGITFWGHEGVGPELFPG